NRLNSIKMPAGVTTPMALIRRPNRGSGAGGLPLACPLYNARTMLKPVLALALLAFPVCNSVCLAEVLYIKAGRLIVDASQPPISQGAVLIADGIVTASGAA